MRKILKNQLYLKVLLSDLISNLGDTLYFIALMTYVTELKDSNLAVSIINLSETIPILFTVFFGIIADRTLNKVETIIKTLWILASMVNLVSDTLGQFENGLFYPISSRIVEKSDREEAMAFRQTVTSTMNIVNQSLGAFLITILSFFHLALINSLTFAISLCIMLVIKHQIDDDYDDQTSSSTSSTFHFKTLFSEILSNLKLSIKHLFSISHMKAALLVIRFLMEA